MYKSEPGWLRGRQNIPYQKLQKSLDLNPVKLSHELWLPAFQLPHKSKLHGSPLRNTSTLVLTPTVDPTSDNHGFPGCSEFCMDLIMPSSSRWMTVYLYSLFSLDFLFTFVKLASEVKVFAMVFSYVFYFVSSSFYSYSQSSCPPFAGSTTFPTIPLSFSCHSIDCLLSVPSSFLRLYFFLPHGCLSWVIHMHRKRRERIDRFTNRWVHMIDTW
jgi:hypothetical protein